MWHVDMRVQMLEKIHIREYHDHPPGPPHTHTHGGRLPLPFKTTLSQGNFQFPSTCKHAVLPQLLWSSNRAELCPGGRCAERWLGAVCFSCFMGMLASNGTYLLAIFAFHIWSSRFGEKSATLCGSSLRPPQMKLGEKRSKVNGGPGIWIRFKKERRGLKLKTHKN